MGKAFRRFYFRAIIEQKFLIDMAIFDVGYSREYPEGAKYGLICRDMESGDFILMDNHYPKGHHIHINEDQFIGKYINDEKLVTDFHELVLRIFGVKL